MLNRVVCSTLSNKVRKVNKYIKIKFYNAYIFCVLQFLYGSLNTFFYIVNIVALVRAQCITLRTQYTNNEE